PENAVLCDVQVLKLVDKQVVPAIAYCFRHVFPGPEEALGETDQVIEVHHVAATELLDVLAIEVRVAAAQHISLETVPTEEAEYLTLTPAGNPKPAKHSSLVVLICDPKTRTNSCLLRKLPQQGVTEGMDGATGEGVSLGPQCAAEPHGDFLSRLVGERDCADPICRDTEVSDEILNSFDQTPRLPCTWAGEHEHRTQRSLDGTSLLGRWFEGHALPPSRSARAQFTIVSTSSSIT